MLKYIQHRPSFSPLLLSFQLTSCQPTTVGGFWHGPMHLLMVGQGRGGVALGSAGNPSLAASADCHAIQGEPRILALTRS